VKRIDDFAGDIAVWLVELWLGRAALDEHVTEKQAVCILIETGLRTLGLVSLLALYAWVVFEIVVAWGKP
jgi:hypothetical protein